MVSVGSKPPRIETESRTVLRFGTLLVYDGTTNKTGDRTMTSKVAQHIIDNPFPIVVLCGSTRFADEFNRLCKALTEAGEIVLTIEVDTTQSREQDPLDELHKCMIDLADYVLVFNVGDYIGESARSEIVYAKRIGKPVTYLTLLPAQ